jgi:hypothetical protein
MNSHGDYRGTNPRADATEERSALVPGGSGSRVVATPAAATMCEGPPGPRVPFGVVKEARAEGTALLGCRHRR